jgi:hypothetical protein
MVGALQYSQQWSNICARSARAALLAKALEACPALTNYWAGCILPRHGGASRGGFGQRNRAADDPSFGNRSLYRLDRMACGLHVTRRKHRPATANEHNERAPQ